MHSRSTLTVGELARPLADFLEINYPKLSEEARLAFAVQIVIATQRGDVARANCSISVRG